MEAAQYREKLDIAAVPMMRIEYYKYLRSRYNQLISQKEPTLPERPPEMLIQADSKEARDLLMGAMRSLKRSFGYGG